MAPDTDQTIIDAQRLGEMLVGGARNVARNKDALNRMNVFPVPDGDTGTNLAMTLDRMEQALGDGEHDTPGTLADAAAQGALLGARGNSGVIMSQILRGFADGLDSAPDLDPMALAHAMVSASDRAYQAVIRPVEGTILTVIKDAAGAAVMRSMDEGVSVRQVLNAALTQARETLARTPEMLKKLRQAGVVDAGGQGLVYFFEGMLKALLGEILTVARTTAAAPLEAVAHPQQLDFKYCTEVSFKAPPGALDATRVALQHDTDSLMVVGAGDMVKVHVHTNRPDTVLAQALEHGELLEVKVDNMALQHNEVMKLAAAPDEDEPEAHAQPQARAAVVAVSNGPGLSRIFKSFGALAIVAGGQSMNPSTEDFLNAIESLPEPEIILLPNNGNIILAAERAAEMCGRPARVVPTKTVPQGFAAMLSYDKQTPVEELAGQMAEDMTAVITAEVTHAVRDSSVNDLDIREGDCIAVVDGDVREAAPDIAGALESVLEIFADNDVELVTFYWGDDLPDDEARALVEQASQKFPDFDYELHHGGQPLYDFIISGE